jgi:hypothetical protein
VNPRIFRLLIGFLAGFVLLSLAPSLPVLLAAARDLPSPDQVGDLLLATTAGLLLVLLVAMVRRRAHVAPTHALARTRGGSSPVAPTHAMAPTSVRQGPALTRPASQLQAKICTAARKGERVPALARRHGLSVDAIRVALGEAPTAPAARRGSSFRARQQAVPAAVPAKALAKRRNPYGALA